MSRHGYTDDYEQQENAMWRGMVASAIRGKRGQRALRDLLAALDAMPQRRLMRNVFRDTDGECCSLGLLAEARGVANQMPVLATYDMTHEEAEAPGSLDPEYDGNEIREIAGQALDIAGCLAAEVMYENDEGPASETPEQRWERMRRWVAKRIKEPKP